MLNLQQINKQFFEEYQKTLEELKARYPTVTEEKREKITLALQSAGIGSNENTAQTLRYIADIIDSPFMKKLREYKKPSENSENN